MELNKIYNEDCLNTMKCMDDNFIDLTVTSPPYDNLRKYNGYSFDFEDIARELFRVTKIGGVVVWVVADSTSNGSESGTSFRQALYFMGCGFNLHDTMIYGKNNYIHLTHNRYEQSWEYMFIFSKRRPKTFNPLMVKTKGGGIAYNLKRKGYCQTIKEGAQRRRDEFVVTSQTKISPNIFYYSCGGQRTGHPAPFSDQLAEDHISTWSNKGELIYDPFMGSGTTAKGAMKLGRNFIGSEISAEYTELANKQIRINEHNLFNQTQ